MARPSPRCSAFAALLFGCAPTPIEASDEGEVGESESSPSSSRPNSNSSSDSISAGAESAEEGSADDGEESTADPEPSPSAPTVPLGTPVDCGNAILDFEVDVDATAMDPRTAYWMMWFAWRAKVSDSPQFVAELDALGFDAPIAIAAGGGLQAFVSASPEVTILSFRSSEEIADWITNFSFTQLDAGAFGQSGRVHAGFANALEGAWPQIEAALQQTNATQRPLLITGQSLGGALSTLAGWRAKKAGFDVSAVYAFGNPRAGDRAWAQSAWSGLDGRVYRFINGDDLVPRVPPAGLAATAAAAVLPFSAELPAELIEDLDYAHVGRPYAFRTDGSLDQWPDMDDSDDLDFWSSLDAAGWFAILELFQVGGWHDIDAYLCLSRAHAYGF